jgi:hypothetical protein
VFFKVRKVKSTTDDPSKSIQKESSKTKTSSSNNNISLSPKQQQQQLKQQQLGTMGTGRIRIYDVSKMFPYSKQLGQQYVLLDDPEETCAENARLAGLAGRPDLEKMWRVCARVAESANRENFETENHVPWTHHPMGRPMLTSMIDHFVKILDFQTAAMMTCTFYHQKIADPEMEDETSALWYKVKLTFYL